MMWSAWYRAIVQIWTLLDASNSVSSHCSQHQALLHASVRHAAHQGSCCRALHWTPVQPAGSPVGFSQRQPSCALDPSSLPPPSP